MALPSLRKTSPSAHDNDTHPFPNMYNAPQTNLDVVQTKAARTFPVDAVFNGIPLRFKPEAPQSSVHCVKSNANDKPAWMFRSCQFLNLCYDLSEKDYVVFRDDAHPSQPLLDNRTQYMSLGGINPRWDSQKGFDKGSWKMEWFPRIKQPIDMEGYYELPTNLVLIPFHSLAAHNVGHLLWDDFYPIYTLLRMFNLERQPLLPIRHRVAHVLYANCDIRYKNRKRCKSNFLRFLPLLGVDPATFTTSKETVFNSTDGTPPKSRYVCAARAVAGLGTLTDHGFRDHGWNDHTEDGPPHNLGRGALFRDFRDFMVQHMLGTSGTTDQPMHPYRIRFSRESSRDWSRRLNFTQQITHLEGWLDDPDVSVEVVTLWNMSLREQVELAASTSIFVTACGGGSMTATFLPVGATLIVFYDPVGGFDFQSYELTHKPARLDWDLLNNAAHIRVHWLPVSTMDEEDDLVLLLQLIQHELFVMRNFES
jgi:hypothetical protein